MKKHRIVLLAVSLLLIATGALAQEISRLSAQFKNFDGTETTTNVAAAPTGTGGALAYSKAVFVPFLSGGQVLYITISAVGDNHNGESNFISCNIDGPGGVGSLATVCNPTPTSFGVDIAPPGWIGLTHHFSYEVTYTSNGLTGLSSGDGGGGTSDEHDNAYYYTWCKRVSAWALSPLSLYTLSARRAISFNLARGRRPFPPSRKPVIHIQCAARRVLISLSWYATRCAEGGS